MKIIPIKHGLDEIVGISTGPRSPGLHMSTIYNDLFQDLEPKRFVRGSKPDPLRMEAGLALEEVLEEGLVRRWSAHRPGEFVTEEGIAYTPDMLIFGEPDRLGEIKLTWMSTKGIPLDGPANRFDPKFDKYICQMKAYCYHLGLSHARLIVYFVNGSGHSPELHAWDIEFTAQELRDNWTMLLNHARAKKLL